MASGRTFSLVSNEPMVDMPSDDVAAKRSQAVVFAAKSTEDKRGSISTQLEDCRAMADSER